MTAPPNTDSENRALRWGGLAGMLGSVLFIGVFVLVGVFVGADPAAGGAIARFPEIQALRTVENGLYLLVIALWVVHFLALYRALRSTSPALFGTGLGIVGLTVLAAGAVPHAATVVLADLYHAPGATATDQATLIIVWDATQGIYNALLVTGLVILPLSLVTLGVAMLQAPAFGVGYGRASVALGVIGSATAVALLVDPQSFIAVVGVFALIAFHLAIGWRLLSLSRRQARAEERRLTAADAAA